MSAKHFVAQLPPSHECQAHGVDAVTQTRRRRTILKHMPQMRAAPPAMNLRPIHPPRQIALFPNILRRNGSAETRPAGPRIELRPRIEKRRAAANAPVQSIAMEIPEFPRKGHLRIRPARHRVLIHSQLPLPLRIRLANGGHFRNPQRPSRRIERRNANGRRQLAIDERTHAPAIQPNNPGAGRQSIKKCPPLTHMRT